jgi:hypothetical protein
LASRDHPRSIDIDRIDNLTITPSVRAGSFSGSCGWHAMIDADGEKPSVPVHRRQAAASGPKPDTR